MTSAEPGARGATRARPRVLVVTTWLPSEGAPSTGVFVGRDIAALTRVADLRVVHLVPPGATDAVSRHLLAGVPVWQVPMSPTDPVSVLGALPHLRAALAGADVLHSMAVSSLVPLALLRPDIPWVHTEHWSAFAADPTGPRGMALRVVASAERLPHVVAAVSPFLAHRLHDLSGRSVEVVPNVVDAPPPTPRRVLGGGDVLEVVGVGALVPRKRPLLAVEAVAAIIAGGRAARLTWVGSGPLEGQVRERARRLGVPLVLTGSVPAQRVPALLAASDVFLVPSLRETFFLGAAEALAAGRPVVVGEAGGPGFFVRPPAGIVVDSADPRDFARGVLRVMDMTSGMDAAEIARGVRAFTPAALADAYDELYRRAGDLHRAGTRRRSGNGRMSPCTS